MFVSPPYDSHPKYTPVILGLIELLVHCCALALLAVVSPATVSLFSHVSIEPSEPRWYSKHCQLPVGRALDVAMP